MDKIVTTQGLITAVNEGHPVAVQVLRGLVAKAEVSSMEISDQSDDEYEVTVRYRLRQQVIREDK